MKSQDRDLSNYGPIPTDPAADADTEPNLFQALGPDDPTKPKCFFCGRSSFDADDAFERGVRYAITQAQGLFQQRGMAWDVAKALADWLRDRLSP